MDEFTWILIIGIMGVAFLTFGLLDADKKKQKYENKEREIKERSTTDDNAVEHKFELGTRCLYRVRIDEKNKSITVIGENGSSTAIQFGDLLGCEVICDDQVSGGIGRAVVGGLLAGEAGAIVGAVTAKKMVSSYKVVLYCMSIQNPTIEMTLITEKTATDSVLYRLAEEFAGKINASAKVIMVMNGQKV